MHFFTREQTGDNTFVSSWHQIDFEEDFKEYLQMFGHLPITSIRKLVEERREIQQSATQIKLEAEMKIKQA